MEVGGRRRGGDEQAENVNQRLQAGLLLLRPNPCPSSRPRAQHSTQPVRAPSRAGRVGAGVAHGEACQGHAGGLQFHDGPYGRQEVAGK